MVGSRCIIKVDIMMINRIWKITVLVLIVVVSVFATTICLAENTLSGLNLEDFERKTDDRMKWRENPFVQPANDVAVGDLILSGIVYNNNNAAAIINDVIVSEGDRIGSNEILDIEKTRVLIRNENGIFSLFLGGGIK